MSESQLGLFGERCTHDHTEVVPTKRGPHYAQLRCKDCNSFLKWLPKPETLEQEKRNKEVLTSLAKLDNLYESEREFIRDMAGTKKLSPRQQEWLDALEKHYLGNFA